MTGRPLDGRLAGKRALVTGAGSGVGRAAALRFAREGACVAVLDVRADAARAVVEEAAGAGGTALPVVADLADEAQVAAGFGTAVGEFGGLDVVVANAGIQLFGEDARVHELAAEVWDRTHTANLRGAFLTCKHGVRALLAAGGGSLICTGSPTGVYGCAPGFTAYSSSKAGIHGMARVIAVDYAADNIRVNTVLPGFTDTPLVTTVMTDDVERERLLAAIPLHRPGRPEDMAAMMVYLASDEAAYATGGMFTVDGGLTAI